MAYRAKTVEELDDLVADLPPRPIGRLRRALHALRQPRPAAETLEVELPLPRGASVLTLGRADSCDLRLADLTVSRVHAQLRRVGGEWRIRDLGSTNGTWLNGARIEEAPLHPGDSLALGGLHLGMR